MALTLNDYYLPGWREQPHPCPACGWQGTSRQMEMELHDEQTEYSCPGCENPLLIIVHPDLAQMQAAAKDGNPEAIEQLALLQEFQQSRG